MADIAELGIRVDSRQVRQGSEALDDFARRGARAEVSANSLMGVVKSLGAGLAGLALIVKAMDFGSAVIGAQRDFDKLNASLITVTGSAGGAQKAFQALQRFAANTPYSVEEATKAFLQLRNLGLTPSERALMSYGNTASSMSKDLTQMVEAVADAATGEFERLKEFGIKAKQEGDKVSLTFQGTTTTIANNAQSIEEYLIRLGETKFAGAMEQQANTLNGAIGALDESWKLTLLSFSQSGFGDAVMASVLGLSGALGDLRSILEAVTGAADAEKKKIEEMGPVHKALTTIFETIAVLGANVAYVFTTIGKDIGAFAAAVVAAASGDFKLMLQIATQRKQDSERERKEIDERTDAILNAAEKGRETREKEAADQKQKNADYLESLKIQSKAVVQQTDAQKAAAKERAKAAQDAAQWYKHTTQAFEESIAMARSELDAVGELTPAQRDEIKVRQEMARVAGLLTPKQKAVIDGHLAELSALELLNAEREHAAQLMRDQGADNASAIKAADDETKALEDRIKYFGLTEAAVLRLKAAELERQMAGAEGNALEMDRLFRLLTATEDQIALQERLARMDADKGFWTGLEDAAHQTFLSIQDGNKGLWERMKQTASNVFFEWLYQMTLKKWIINIGASISGTAGVSGIANTASSAGASSAAGSLLSGATNALGLGGLASTAAAFGGSVAAGFTAAFGAGGSLAATLSAAMAGATAAPIASLGLAAGVLGPIALGVVGAVKLLDKAFGRGPKTTTGTGITGTFGVDSFAGENYTEWMKKGGWFSSTKRGTDTSPLGAEQSAAINSAYKAIKDSTAAFAEALGVPADVVTSYGKTIRLAFTGDTTKDQKLLADLFAQMGDELATRVLPNIGQFIQQGETAATTLQRVANNFVATDAIMQAIGVDGAIAFGAVGVASIEARERLLAVAGGVDALTSQVDYFAQNFMTEAERLAPVQKAVAEQMAALGHAGLTTNDQFKGLVMGLASSGALATEAGAKTYAALLALAPAFKTVADAAAAAREKTASLEEQIFALTHTDGEVLARQREAELAALSATDRALQLRIYALQDEAAAAEATAAALEKNEASLRAFVDSAMDAVQRAVEAQRKAVQKAYDSGMAALQVRIDGVTTTISTLNDLAGVLKNGLSSMTMQGTESATRAAAQAQIEAALAIARAGGALPTADSIRDAVGLASKTSTDDFSSFIEYQRDFVRTSSALAELAGLTDGQMTDAQKQLAALNAEKNLLDDWYKQQTESLDAALEKAQEQVDAINGVNTSVLSVAQALGLLAASIGNLKNGATPSNPTGTGMTMEQLYQTVLGRAPDAAGAAYWAPIFGDSIDEDDIRNFINGAQGELAGRVPGFANGGSHAGGWRVVGERGPELENTGPSRIVSNGGVQDLFGGLEARIESLETTLAVGLTRLIDETKRGADAAEEFADNTSDEEVIG